jgi:hypothetical protein
LNRKSTSPIPEPIVQLQRQLDQFRSARPHRMKLPETVWELIHTCQLCGVNSFDYLFELLRHARELAARPAEWMSWNYRETLERTASLPESTEL